MWTSPPPAPILEGPPDLLSWDPCRLSLLYMVSEELARKLFVVAAQFERETGKQLVLLSGYRSKEEQDALRAEGRPAAPDDVSTHRSCPATGADVWPGPLPTSAVKATLGRIAIEAGLRWGGGSNIDPETGIPSDWTHLDLGPRKRS